MSDSLTAWKQWCALRTGREIPNYDPDATATDGMWFDPDAADAAIEFIAEGCIHIHGDFAGKPVVLEGWQEAIVGAIFGWKRADGTRRYREAFIEIARKNGKTLLVACIIILMMFLDDEAGAEIYSAAGNAKQAGIVFKMVAAMIERSDFLSDLAVVNRGMGQAYLKEDRATFYESLSRESGTKHGLNAHFAVVDELHVQEKPDLYETLRTSMGTRRQPLMICITTADYNRPSLCNDREGLALRICSGQSKMPEFLPVVYRMEDTDDWHDESLWVKANPNVGVSIDLEYLRQRHAEACEMPTRENEFKRLHLNIKTQTNTVWLPMDAWHECGRPFDLSVLEGRRCWGGLDLSTTADITAFVLAFEPDEDDDESPVYAIPFFWMPKDNARKKEKLDGVPYNAWARDGLITMTEGNTVDQKFVRAQIVELSKKYRIQDIGYDTWQAVSTVQELQDEHGLTMIEMRQGINVMNGPCKYLESLVSSRRLAHGGNPVLSWMAGNAVVRSDADGRIKINKAAVTQRVDGIVALAMALGRLEVGAGAIYSKSYIEDCEVMVL
jgi:phage terminase large subunit-like protein